MYNLVVSGGLVVTPHGPGYYDIGIQGEQIVALALRGGLAEPADQTIDATGMIVVPGGVEPHAHINTPTSRGVSTQQAAPASRACVFGGTTTIFDFAVSLPQRSPVAAVEEKIAEWKGHSYADFTFHCTMLGEALPEHIEQIPDVVGRGITSIKCYTRGSRPHRIPPARQDNGRLFAIMKRAASHGAIMLIHGEDDDIMRWSIETLQREGRAGVENLHLAYNNLSEDISFRNTIRLAENAGAALYFVHVSAKEGVRAIGEARSRGLPVYGETLHSYTAFSAEKYSEPDGVKYHTYPSLKYPEDRDTLWAGLIDGRLQALATDEWTTHLDVKLAGKTVADATGGHNGCETRLPYLFSEGVASGRMSLSRFVELSSSNVAKLFGIYPQKGAVAVGSDADLAVIDPNLHKKLRVSDLHADSDYSIWEGWEFKGWPITTVLRGKIIVDRGQLLGDVTDGAFLPRKSPSEVLSRPTIS